MTGKEKRITRRNFTTKKEVQLALAKLLVETEKMVCMKNNQNRNIQNAI
ncbi:TPA: Arm DNA-binding domain-containing protein [Listeria monocytogenes]|nr:Arm DNA-binding domain-containing protein [Listeria monocytogenes]